MARTLTKSVAGHNVEDTQKAFGFSEG